jgi:predicted O-linked N-acetylglucosamine transferase (SPINDLY family)
MLGRLLQSVLGQDASALNARGIAAWQRGDLASAEELFRSALKRDSNHASAASNLGMVLAARGRMDDAVVVLREAVAIDPRHVGARINLAVILHQGGGIPEAVSHLDQALELEPGNRLARANRIKPLMDLCDWAAVAREVETLKAEAQAGATRWADAIPPYVSLLLPFSPAFQLAVARHHAMSCAALLETDPRTSRLTSNAAEAGRRLRIGYLSADFHDHATAHLSLGLYAAHDRTHFDITAYSIGQVPTHGDGSEYRRRIEFGCDSFVEASDLSSAQLARRIAADRIDILVDMKGYTGGARPDVMARRPAPLQVSYLGYPGTMGADFIDYLIADRVLVPEGSEQWYAEKIVYMPASYQINDDAQAIADSVPPRATLGLPDGAFVFCCFNQLYKTEPQIFAAWMRILQAVPGSVLWLQCGHPVAEERLRAAAAAAGVDPARLVFAPYERKTDHLARHAYADLFLDAHVVNAHTTASDALWAGVPLLTWPGETFASRVAASLLNAVGMADCVMPDLAAYEARAVQLAFNPDQLMGLQNRLAANRKTTPLFDTGACVAALELAYRRMWVDRCHGGRQVSFRVGT